LTGWVVVTFASFFRSLNAEPYGTATALPEGCINPDKDFEDYSTTLRLLFESGLSGEGHFECFRAASTRNLGVPAAYAYIVFTVIVLTNMLIAMMAKTFGAVVDTQTEVYFYMRARQTMVWSKYGPLPPPLNLLGLPYLLIISPARIAFRVLFHLTCQGSLSLHELRQMTRPAAQDRSVELPSSWREQHNLDDVLEDIRTFCLDISDGQQTVIDELRRTIRDMSVSMTERFDALAAQTHALTNPSQSYVTSTGHGLPLTPPQRASHRASGGEGSYMHSIASFPECYGQRASSTGCIGACVDTGTGTGTGARTGTGTGTGAGTGAGDRCRHRHRRCRCR